MVHLAQVACQVVQLFVQDGVVTDTHLDGADGEEQADGVLTIIHHVDVMDVHHAMMITIDNITK